MPLYQDSVDLIETFCIVNSTLALISSLFELYLIETFCIVNAFRSSKQALNEKS